MKRVPEEPFCRILDGRSFYEFLLQRNRETTAAGPDLDRRISSILKDVTTRGDQALLEATSEYDGVTLTAEEIPVEIPSLGVLRTFLGLEVVEVIERAAVAIRRYHELEKERAPGSWIDVVAPGARAGKIVVPLERVGIYVPGGRAPYISTVLMTAIPAKVAGVREVIACTPPVCRSQEKRLESGSGPGRFSRENAKALLSPLGPAPEILAAAAVAGVDRMFRIGGPQAIAAMAYGTETVPKVDKIAGPGNRYVQAAKMAVFGRVDVDMPAGPSEVCIIADDTAFAPFLAFDLLSQIEHGPDSLSVLLTTSQTLLEEVRGILMRDTDVTGSGIFLVVVDGVDQAVDLANLLAPEHLQVMVEDADRVVRQVRNAGAVYVGPYTPTSLGDYAAGPSHVLPTQGNAKAFGALGVGSFLKTINVACYSEDAYKGLATVAVKIAELEGMKAHTASLKVRLDHEKSGGSAEPNFDGLCGSISARRFAEVVRTTKETRIRIALDLDRPGASSVRLGGVENGFFGHMLDTLAHYWGVSLEIEGTPDPKEPECGGHHLLEDVGIVLGRSLRKAVGGGRPIERFAYEVVPMDDALAAVAVDISGRPHLSWDIGVPGYMVGGVEVEGIREFFAGFSRGAGVTLHVRSMSGDSSHHIIEAVFKAFGRALSRACRPLEGGRTGGAPVNSTKGVLDQSL